MKIVRRSPVTGDLNTMEIDVKQHQIDAWEGGTLIQKAMPNLTVDEREFIMSGLTVDDWELLFDRHETSN